MTKPFSPTREFTQSIRRGLEYEAWKAWAPEQLVQALGPEVNLSIFVKILQRTQTDQYDELQSRSRLFGGGLLFPWDETRPLVAVPPRIDPLSKAPFSGYFQPAELNPQAGGLDRKFAPFPAEFWADPNVERLVKLFLDCTPAAIVSRSLPVAFHIHAINMVSDGVRAAISSPDVLHQDGDPVTFVLLVDRTLNSRGAVSYVARTEAAGLSPQDVPPDQLLAEFTLFESWSGFAVWDDRVAHAVSPLTSRNGMPAVRSALLIDFCNVTL